MSNTDTTIWKRVASFFSGKRLPKRGAQDTDPDGGITSSSGVVVSDDRALQISAVWACIRLVVETVGSLPGGVFEESNGVSTRIHDNQLSRLMRQPNRYMNAVDFFEAMTANLTMQGNAYAVIERNAVGQPSSLWPLYASAMVVDYLDDGSIVYKYSDGKNVMVYAPESILHVKGFGLNGLVGLAPLAYARQSIGLSIAAETYGAKFFANGARPGGVLMIDKVLKPEQRAAVKKNFSDMHEGSSNAHRLHVLEANMKYQQMSIPPEDAQMLETRRFQVEDIARFFRVPSFLINDTAKTTSWGKGLEQQNLAFLAYSLRPYLTRWEQAINSKLVLPKDRAKTRFKFDLEDLLRGDSQARASYYGQMTQNGLMTRNEARAKENLPPMPGGDQLTAQVNLAPLEQLGQLGHNEGIADE